MLVVVPIVTAQLRRTGDPVAAPVSRVVLVLLGLQLLLGPGASWLASHRSGFPVSSHGHRPAGGAPARGQPHPGGDRDPGRESRGVEARPAAPGPLASFAGPALGSPASGPRGHDPDRSHRRRGRARDRRRVVTDLIALTKPRGVLMILVTTVVGYYVGLTGAPDYARVIHLLIGTLLAAGGTLALNQYWERDVDARMERTRVRPCPTVGCAARGVALRRAVTVAGSAIWPGRS